jgi:excisionase family DNA binding protein
MMSRTDTSVTDDAPLTRREADEFLEKLRRLLNAGVKPSRLLTIPEAAERLRMSRTSVYKLLGNGELERRNVGRSVRIAEEDVERFIARQGEQ